MNSNTKHKAAAFTFYKWVLQPENQKQLQDLLGASNVATIVERSPEDLAKKPWLKVYDEQTPYSVPQLVQGFEAQDAGNPADRARARAEGPARRGRSQEDDGRRAAAGADQGYAQVSSAAICLPSWPEAQHAEAIRACSTARREPLDAIPVRCARSGLSPGVPGISAGAGVLSQLYLDLVAVAGRPHLRRRSELCRSGRHRATSIRSCSLPRSTRSPASCCRSGWVSWPRCFSTLRFRARRWRERWSPIPWAAPPVAVALIFTWMLNAQYGIFNRALRVPRLCCGSGKLAR